KNFSNAKRIRVLQRVIWQPVVGRAPFAHSRALGLRPEDQVVSGHKSTAAENAPVYFKSGF
ncbi:MAG: hypothetical protein ACI4LE_00330, partial [Faecalibacterium sp.]